VSTAWADRVESGHGHVGSGAIEPVRGRCGVRRRGEQLVAGVAFDHEHGFRAERALDLSCGRGLLRRCSSVEQEAATQQRTGPFTVAEEAEVTDAGQAFWKDVDEEAPQELVSRDRHHLLLAAGCVVLPPERDVVILEADEAIIRDRDAMGVAGQVI
jgi:hypothetical protein